MSLSFEDSRKKMVKTADVTESKIATTPIVKPVADDTEVFTRSPDYDWYDQYSDENMSYVHSDTKDIIVDPSQINLTQEQNSQYIPFEIDRFYDGIDLTTMKFRINFENSMTEGGSSRPINVEYSNTKIRFGWLVDEYATSVAGVLNFEIEASGYVQDLYYIWRTKPNGKLNILQSLKYTESIVKPDNNWFTQFTAEMDKKIEQAAQYMRATKEYVDTAKSYSDLAAQSATNAQGVVDQAIDDIIKQTEASLGDLVAEAMGNYYTKPQVDQLLKDIDLSGFMEEINQKIESIDGLAKFKVTYDPETRNLVFLNGDTPMYTIPLNSNPTDEWTNEFREEIDEKIANAKPNLEGYYTSAQTDELLETKASVADVAEISNKVGALGSAVKSVESEISTLNVDVSELEEIVKNLDTENLGNEYDVNYNQDTNIFQFIENGEVKQQFVITGGSGGGGDSTTITIERISDESTVVLLGAPAVIQYKFTSVDNAGDATGNGTASWRVGNTVVATSTAIQGVNSFDITQYLRSGENNIRLSITDSFGTISSKTWTITVVEFKLESTFDDTLFYSGDVTFRYTPYGDISKDIVFVLDNSEIARITSPITGRQLTQTISVQQHGSHLLKVYMEAKINEQTVTSDPIYKDIIWVEPNVNTPIIGCYLMNFSTKQYSTVNIPYVVYDPSHNPATIQLYENEKLVSTLTVDRTKQIWNYKTAEVGVKTLKIVCGKVEKSITATIEKLDINIEPVPTNLAIDFNPSGKSNNDNDRLWTDGKYSMSVSDNFDWSNGGYQIDSDGDTYFCVKAGTTATIDFKLFADDAKKTGKNFKLIYKCTNVRDYDAQVLTCKDGNIGFQVFAQQAVLTSEQNNLPTLFCEDTYMELEFNILPDSQFTEMVMWLDGIPTRVKLYSSSDSFTQANPANITIGSDDCDVWIYRVKSYTMNLTDDEILDNFIADAKNAEEMINRYTRNDILDSSGGLDPDLLAEKCPDLRIIKIETPRFTTGKKDKVTSTSFQQIYKNGRPMDNWTSLGGVHSGQGTSSEYYGDSGRNLDLDCKNGFNFSDGSTAEKYGMTENSVPVNYFNIKVNVASSENKNNDGLAEDYNTFNPYKRQARIDDPRVRDTMEFHPCVVFLKETDIENAVEFHDGQWHFYACGNIGNSKKNSEAMGMVPENHKEFIVEVMNNTDPQCRFLSDDLSNEAWDGDGSFEMRYENPEASDEELQAGKDAWQTFLTWVVNVTPENFVKEFEDHCIKNSVLFNYLFTERHTMVDNRAKNTFWHTEDLIHWDICFDYDNDTAMGNDNVGGLTLTYGYEDTDTIGTKSVFNASDSKIWCYVRDYMHNDLAALFQQLESQLAWSASRILTEFEQEQALKPERLWIADMRRKYFRPYETAGTTSYLEMMHGTKKHQRKQFQVYQEKYMSSKYIGAACTSDVITIRGYTPVNWEGVKPDGTFHIQPYADTYIVNRYGSNVTKVRAKRGKTYEVKSPIEAMNDTEVYTYNASLIRSIGDIAPFYPGYCNFNQGIKLTDLTIGSNVEGYENTNMIDFSVGQNVLLEHLNLQNLPNLKKAISLEDCANLTEFLADGSGITGIVFATGGKLQIAHLPAVASITAKRLYFLTDFSLEGYDNITTLSIDDCPTIDELDLITKSQNLNRVRLIGIDWELSDTNILDRLAKMTGIDENGYNSPTSVLLGSVHVPIMREKKLAEYRELWPDLEITYDTLITQFSVTFLNYDKTVLDVQYVDKGEKAVDPITREIDSIPVPTKPSTVSTDFTFSGWDSEFVAVFSNQTINALYSEKVREYTVQYVSKGTVLQKTTAPYNTVVYYEGEDPSYTAEEAAYKYHLFKGWDKSGLVTGDKEISAVYDTFEYNIGFFDDKELNDLRPVEIYALTKLGIESEHVTLKDTLTLEMGHDYSYEDIEEKVFISEKTEFLGSNYIDTGVSIFDIDRDFVFAIDYKFDVNNSNGAVLAQCFQADGVNGFRLWYNTEPRLTWGTASTSPSKLGKREMVVLRHIKGETGLHVYSSNLDGNESAYVELSKSRPTLTDKNATLVFGCSKADDGAFESYAIGTVYWSKIWYIDLGEKACKNLVSWTHEQIPFEMCGFKRYYLSENSSKRCSMSFLASRLLSRDMILGSSSSNTGGWAACSLNKFLNSRLYSAFSTQWKQLIKLVKINSSIGDMSLEISSSDCYVAIPSVSEVSPTVTEEPYCYEGTPIPYLTTNQSRICTRDTGEAAPYWLRSPNVAYSTYFYRVDEVGSLYGYFYAYNEGGVRIMFSI